MSCSELDTIVAPPEHALSVHLMDGHSAQRELVLVAGAPMPPVVVGSSGDWCVAGAHVAPRHVVLAWSGSRLYACALPGQRAVLDGRPLGMTWRELSTLGEVRFGSARLVALPSARPGVSRLGESTLVMGEEARSDGDARAFTLDARPSVSLAMTRSGRRELSAPPRHVTMPLARPIARRDDRLGARAPNRLLPSSFHRLRSQSVVAPSPDTPVSVVVAPRDARNSAEILGPQRVRCSRTEPFAMPLPLAASSGVEVHDPIGVTDPAHVVEEVTDPAEAEVEQAGGYVRSSEIVSVDDARVSSQPATTPGDRIGAGVEAASPSSPTLVCALSSESAGVVGAPLEPGASPSIVVPGEHTTLPRDVPPGRFAALRELRERGRRLFARPKTMAVLLPVVALGALCMQARPSAPLEPPGSSRIARQTTVASARVDAGQPAIAAPAAHPGSSLSPCPACSDASAPVATSSAPSARAGALPASGAPSRAATLSDARTPQRRALDAAASGAYASAAEQYDALSSAHPEDLAFREAARILHQRAGR